MLFTNPDSMFAFLKESYLSNPRPVAIATYNMYLGIPPLIECREGCADCREKYKILMQRFIDTKNELEMNLRFSTASHLKMYSIGSLIISGGINLATSEFTDATFTVDSGHVDEMMDLFNKHWKKADITIDGYKPQTIEAQ